MTWKHESERHALASKGVKTSCGKEDYKKVSLDEIKIPGPYDVMDEDERHTIEVEYKED